MEAHFIERLGDLPRSWATKKVGVLCRVGTGGTPNTKIPEYYVPATVNWIKSGDVKGFHIRLAAHRISVAGLENSAATLHPRGTVLMAMSGRGKTRATTAILDIEAACSQSVAAIIPGVGVDSEFLHFQFARRYSEIRNITGNDDRSGLNMSLIRDIDLTVPPLTEQRRIAGVLGLVQRAIEQQERLLVLTTELKKTLLHQLFTQGVRGEPQKQTEIGPLPESWEVVELFNAVEQIDYGISAPIPKVPPEKGIKIVSTADITKDGRLLYDQIRRIEAPEKTVKRLTLQTGDVLFNWRNSAELIGKSAVFQGQSEPHVFASFILRIKCGEKRSHNLYLAHLMNHFREKGVFLKLARRAVNQANYNRNEISVLQIPLPTYQEQRDIAEAIAAVDAKIDHHRQKKAKLDELFRSLLHHLMTAQIRVHDLDLAGLGLDVERPGQEIPVAVG